MLLVLGEVYVDYTIKNNAQECKLRLGGIVHACRGLWACNIPYSAAIICPEYLQEEVKTYLLAHGCEKVINIGNVIGSPNVISILDMKEIGHQGYEDLLRETKKIILKMEQNELNNYQEVLIFPSNFDLNHIKSLFNNSTKFSFDIAYGIKCFSDLNDFTGRISLLLTSTSSELFQKYANEDINPLLSLISPLLPECFILKENRGGSRVYDLKSNESKKIPATLSKTKNSVGVGDVYSAVALAHKDRGWENAAWFASIAATCYSETTFPDDFKRDLQRNFSLPLDILKGLDRTSLPWHERPKYNIYFAAPDFSYIDRKELDYVIDSLKYHNFTLRRPILENGELTDDSNDFEKKQAYLQDVQLLNECDLIFAVPLNRDPGTLIEIGLALSTNKPVITYDPNSENDNNMVITGSRSYSHDLDVCLNSTFSIISDLENDKK